MEADDIIDTLADAHTGTDLEVACHAGAQLIQELRASLTTAEQRGREAGLTEAAAVIARATAQSAWPNTAQTLSDCREEILSLLPASKAAEVKPHRRDCPRWRIGSEPDFGDACMCERQAAEGREVSGG